ncbi:MAG: ABC-F family ATP-binding cassette domain-containing protein [Chitinophagaceae bacterium]
MLVLQNIAYAHPNKDVLVSDINLAVNNHEKIALIGNNGTGKSTLLKIIAKELQPSSGQITVDSESYYVPQIFGQYDHVTVAQALRIDGKLNALHAILDGSTSDEHFNILDDDWTMEERCREALKHWQLDNLDWSQKMETLSGGQKTKLFLAGIDIHQPQLVLLDEPSNHLDMAGRQLLYDLIQNTYSTLIVASHDRALLNLFDTVCELGKDGIKNYGGNYGFYTEQKQIENNALCQDIQNREKALRKAKEKERETRERQQKRDNRGKAKQEKTGVARIMMNTLRNTAENTTSKLKAVHSEKIGGIADDLQNLRAGLPDIDKMQLGFDDSTLHKGKILFTAKDINFRYGDTFLWKENLHFQVKSGEHLALKGRNGAGKTTLIKLILGSLEPQTGTVYRAENQSVYIDQGYSLLDNRLSVYVQAEQYNTTALQEHEIKIRLNRFLFTKDDWGKPCSVLSGGERMRLLLCCLHIGNQSPDLIILDEPTNNLDIQNVRILTAALNQYRGTLIVVSHDEMFLEEVGIGRMMELLG